MAVRGTLRAAPAHLQLRAARALGTAASGRCPVAHGGQEPAPGPAAAAVAAAAADTAAPPKEPSEIPSIPQWPIIHFYPTIARYRSDKAPGFRMVDMVDDHFEKLGPVFRMMQFTNSATYATCSPDYVKVLAIESDDIRGILDGFWSLKQFYARNYPNEKLNPFLLRGEEWRKGRMAVNPFLFNAKAAKSYLPRINDAARSAVASIHDYEERMGDFCNFASLDMFNAVAFGFDLRATAGDPDGKRIANTMLGALTSGLSMTRHAPWSKYDLFKFGTWHSFESRWKETEIDVQQLIERSKQDPDNEGFFRAFLESDNEISEFQAMTMVVILVAAAADTTAATLMNVLLNLSRNPAVQARLRDELRAELQGGDWNANSRCTYLNWVLYENQRISPTITFAHLRNDIEEDVIVEGYRIPKGSNVVFSNRNFGKRVDRPSEFIPERWSDEEKEKRKGTPLEFLDHPLVREPFGHGPRKCVGSRVAMQELRTILSRIVQDYEFRYDEETTAPWEYVTGVTVTPQPSPHIRFTKVGA